MVIMRNSPTQFRFEIQLEISAMCQRREAEKAKSQNGKTQIDGNVWPARQNDSTAKRMITVEVPNVFKLVE